MDLINEVHNKEFILIMYHLVKYLIIIINYFVN